ncbi:MAG: T9SS type A sorting domain-containing protein [Bacteroidales bacterium]|nr:T9SS type A sorting domain-containing protein [Bacteroidales bacterium]
MKKLSFILAALLVCGTMQAQESERSLGYGCWADVVAEQPESYVMDTEGNWADVVTEQPDGYVMDADGNVEIYTPEGLAWLSCVVNGMNGCEPDNFDGRIVRLMADLDLEEKYGLMNLVPIGSSEHRFMGVFDGQDHHIYGLFIYYVNTMEDEVLRRDMALFGYLYHGAVKNLSLNSGFYNYVHPFDMITGEYERYYDALVVAVADSLSLVENCRCHFKVSGLVGNAHPAGTYMAAFVGLNRNSTVRNCAYEMDFYSQAAAIDNGGIVLRNLCEGGYSDAVVENCYFYGNLMGSYSAKNMGGIVCFNETVKNSNGNKAMVRNCYSELLQDLYGFEDQGYIVAYNSDGSLVENCFAHMREQQGAGNEYVELFGTNLGDIANCTGFIISSWGDGLLTEPVVIGETVTDGLVDALNLWVEAQEEPNLYRNWIEGYNIYVPQFGESLHIAEKESLSSTFVYPNPTNGVARIEGVTVSEVQVFNTLGQMVKTVQATNEISVAGLPEGVYVLRITDEKGTAYTERVSVVK